MGLQHPDHQFKSGCRLWKAPEFSGVFLFHRKVSYEIKKRSAGIALRRKGRCRLRGPPQAESFASETLFHARIADLVCLFLVGFKLFAYSITEAVKVSVV